MRDHPTAPHIVAKLKELYPAMYEYLVRLAHEQEVIDNRAKAKTYYYNNKPARQTYGRKYYEAHRDKLLEMGKKYRIKNDYYARRKMKGISNENEKQQAERAD